MARTSSQMSKFDAAQTLGAGLERDYFKPDHFVDDFIKDLIPSKK